MSDITGKISKVLLWVMFTIAIIFIIFVLTLISDPKKAIKTIIMIGSLAGIVLIASIMASSDIIDMPNYDGEDNVPATLKAVGTALYTMYFLFGLAIIATIGSEVAKVFK